MRNGTIEIKLPYPVKIGFIQLFIKRTIGFSFDQRSMFILLKNNEIDIPGYAAWRKKINTNIVISESMFAAAQSYRIERRLKDNFTKAGLLRAFTEASESVKEQIAQCWKDSEELGYKQMPGKKKAARR